MFMIEIKEDKFEKMAEYTEKMLKYGGKLMSCLSEVGEEYGMLSRILLLALSIASTSALIASLLSLTTTELFSELAIARFAGICLKSIVSSPTFTFTSTTISC